MKKRVFLFLFLLTAFIVRSYADIGWGFSVQTVNGQWIMCTVIDETAHTVSVSKFDNSTSTSGDLVIPSTVTYYGETYTVIGIAYSAYVYDDYWDAEFWVTFDNGFENCSGLTSVTIPNTVTYIGMWAFRNCTGLTTLNFNADSCTAMGDYHEHDQVFYGCNNLTTINIGNNVKIIPDQAFMYCTGLTSVTIPSAVTYIGYDAFCRCSSLGTVNFNADSCTYMNDAAFYGCSNLTTLNIGNNVKVIPQYAFNSCSGLTSVTIPSAVTTIGSGAFSGCTGLTTVNFNADSCTLGDGDYYFGGVFGDCSNLTTLNIGNNVRYISKGAFSNCSTLTTVTFGSSVATIDSNAFYGCSGITSLTLPNSLTSIRYRAFYNCSGITSLTLSNSLTNIDRYAFYGCSGITSSLTLPNTLTSIGQYAFYGCSGITSLTLPNSITSISSSAFSGCSGITSLTLPDALDTIGSYAFESCSGLTTVSIPQTVRYTGSSAFGYCNGLTSVDLHADSCTYMNNAFRSCPNLATLNIDTNVKIIPTSAFTGCSGLTSLRIPESVVQIGDYAFSGCTGISRMDMQSEVPPTIMSQTFLNVPTNVPIYVPCGATSAYRSAGFWSNFINYQEDASCYMSVTLNTNNATMGTVVGNGQYPIGGTATIYAIPSAGFQFVSWNDGNTQNPRSLIVVQDTTFTATFSHVPEATTYHVVTTVSSNNAMGTVYGGGTYHHGATVTLMAQAAPGYAFLTWHDNSTENPRTIAVTSDAFYIATFTTAPTTGDTLLVHDTTYVTIHDTVTVTQHDTLTLTLYDTTYVAVHDTTYVDNYIYDTTYLTEYVYDTIFAYDTIIVGETHDTIVVRDTIIVQQEVEYYNLEITCNPSQGIPVGSGHYCDSTIVEIAAIPISGYHFIRWDDGNTENPRHVQVNEDLQIEALFEEDQVGITNIEAIDYSITTERGVVTIEGAQGQRVRIFDSVGRLLKTETEVQEVHNFQMPASGVYLVQVGEAPAQKVVVVK